MHVVVKPFAFSLDGFTLIDLNMGDEREDFGSMADGLVAEGFIVAAEPVAVPTAEPAVEQAKETNEEPTVETEAPKPAPAPVRRGRK